MKRYMIAIAALVVTAACRAKGRRLSTAISISNRLN